MSRGEVWHQLFTLKQEDRPIHTYVAGTRQIRNLLDDRDDEEVRDRFVEGLADLSSQAVGAGLGLAQTHKPTFEEAAAAAIGATGRKSKSVQEPQRKSPAKTQMPGRGVELIKTLQACQQATQCLRRTDADEVMTDVAKLEVEEHKR